MAAWIRLQFRFVGLSFTPTFQICVVSIISWCSYQITIIFDNETCMTHMQAITILWLLKKDVPMTANIDKFMCMQTTWTSIRAHNYYRYICIYVWSLYPLLSINILNFMCSRSSWCQALMHQGTTWEFCHLLLPRYNVLPSHHFHANGIRPQDCLKKEFPCSFFLCHLTYPPVN